MTRTFAITCLCASVLAAAIVALNLAARRADNGAIQVECGALLPYEGLLIVGADITDGAAIDHAGRINAAMESWERASGVTLFGVQPSDGAGAGLDTFRRALRGEGPEPVGRVLVVSSEVGRDLVTDASDTAGHARLRWDPHTCRIGYAVIVLPDANLSDDEWRVVAQHEIGHVLGLAHDPSPASVMHHAARPGAMITEYDAALVRERARDPDVSSPRERDGLGTMEGL